MKVKKTLINLSIISVSTLMGLLLCEWASRLVLDPVDYLSPVLVRDNVLGIRLPAGSSGHDSWGFRNSKVPETVDIVTVGDSHTYGNTAKMAESWPHVLGKLSGKRVYNLGMGGYGPNQYYSLLKNKALGLKPSMIICGFCMGDDFDNSYRITYGLNHWKWLRREGVAGVDHDIWEKKAPPNRSWHKKIRNWLSQSSLLYQLLVHGLLQGVKGDYQVKHASQLYNSTLSLVLPEKNIKESFRPKGLLKGLDQDSPHVQEGTRIAFNLLREMNALCLSNDIQMVVAIIPTKELVFSKDLRKSSGLL